MTIFSLKDQFDGIRIVINARLHLEYFELLISIELPMNRDWGTISGRLEEINSSLLYLHEFAIQRHNMLNSTFNNFDRPSIDSKHTGKKIVDDFKSWVKDIIKEADDNSTLKGHDNLFNYNKFIADDADEPDGEINNFCGNKFVDILGIVFSLKYKESKSLDLAFLPDLNQADSDAKKVYSIERRTLGSKFNDKTNLRLVDSVLPISLSFNDANLAKHYGTPEYTASLFQDDNVLYLSSLGRLTSNPSITEPVIYTLVVSHSNEWRLGRLVDRLHSLGTLRTAALRDIVALTEASDRINILSGKLKESRTDKVKDPGRIKDLIVYFNGIESFNNKIKSKSFINKVDITYRINRSKYYVREFNNILKVMNTNKVVGFQTYDNFIKRRIFDTFDFISTIGLRYDEIRTQLEFELDQIQRDQLRDLYAEIGSDSRESKKLLLGAEIISLVPLTYYMSYMLDHLFTYSSNSLVNSWKLYIFSFITSSIFVAIVHFVFLKSKK